MTTDRDVNVVTDLLDDLNLHCTDHVPDADCEGCRLQIETHLAARAPVTEPPAALTFDALVAANLSRVVRWHPNGLQDWTPLEWAGAMAGEAGEACNAAKKLKRIDGQIANINHEEGRSLTDRQVAAKQVAKEVADTIIYGALLVSAVGQDLGETIIDVFNRKSYEYNFPERLGTVRAPVTEGARPNFRARAEALYEELGGDLCICQRADVPHWCEKCQQRFGFIETELRRVWDEAADSPTPSPAEGAPPPVTTQLLRYLVWAYDNDESLDFLAALVRARDHLGLKLADEAEDREDREALKANGYEVGIPLVEAVQRVGGAARQESQHGESREEFERDRFGETGDRYRAARQEPPASVEAALRAELTKWQTCSMCGERMEQPGYCSSAESERVQGLLQMHEETLTRAERAEAALAALIAGLQRRVAEWRRLADISNWKTPTASLCADEVDAEIADVSAEIIAEAQEASK